jgi:hypothetical protein
VCCLGVEILLFFCAKILISDELWIFLINSEVQLGLKEYLFVEGHGLEKIGRHTLS